ncbi:MAG: ATP-binding cassette domain-containing protein [Chthoniobacterales bacterium]|nr:ATP-binding cassette domain-containing protein [Chthoniobacterales bacterium]
MSAAFLELEDVKTHFPVESGFLFKRHLGTVKAVDGVSLSLRKGEVLGLVGESGCGKSTLGRTILQLVRATAGSVILEGRNLNALQGGELRRARADFQMIFQDPYASLSPRMTVFDTLAEAIRTHKKVARRDMPARVAELMSKVGLLPRAMKKYPHEFSGGQRQRIAIARALAVEPKLIIADEPVSALDVSIQAQIINLIAKLRREMDLTLVFISHDLSVVKHLSDRIAVMYLGKIVELGTPEQVLGRPLHPYTKALVSAVPIPDPKRESHRKRIVLAGDPPSPMNPPVGCPFHPRCPSMIEKCKAQVPPLATWGADHPAACIRVPEIHPELGGRDAADAAAGSRAAS